MQKDYIAPRPGILRPFAATLAVHLVTAASILFGGMSLVRAARAEAAPAAPQPALVRPGDLRSGGLLLPSDREGWFRAAPLVGANVRIEITGPIARARVEQTFTNPSDDWIEALYVFPLPDDAAVDTLKLTVGDRVIEGEVKRREEARAIYEAAREEGRKAGLLEQQRDNIFTQAVANIGPGESVTIAIEYQQAVKQDAGTFSLRSPLVVAPRYSPQPILQQVDLNSNGWGNADPVLDREAIEAPVLDPGKDGRSNPVRIEVRLAAGFEIAEAASTYHDMETVEEDASTRILKLKEGAVPADRDFELTWKARGAAPTAALFRETVNGEDYLLAFLTPPWQAAGNDVRQQREAIFVIDNSGSMAGESMDQAKAALETALSRLSPADRFNVVRFDDTFTVLFPAPVPADRENVQRAIAYVRSLEANGGTEMLPALDAALSLRADPAWLRQVVFITDGAIGNERQLFDRIARARASASPPRVFAVGIGSAPNSFFMNRAAEIGGGAALHIGSTQEVAGRMGAFLEKLENPVVTGLTARVRGFEMSEASPDPLPDLYLGEPVVLAAKVSRRDSEAGVLEISGEFAGRPWTARMDLARAAQGSGIGKLWARRKIASLEASLSFGADIQRVDEEIARTALDHHLVSRLTSLVAVDDFVARPGGEAIDSRKVPLNLPHGWEYEKVFGDQAASGQAQPVQAARTRSLMAAQSPAPTPLPYAAEASQEDLPDMLVAEQAPQPKTTVQETAPKGLLAIVAILLATIAMAFAALRRLRPAENARRGR
jgi:Ca-activated chloride channel family protein